MRSYHGRHTRLLRLVSLDAFRVLGVQAGPRFARPLINDPAENPIAAH